MLCDDTMTLKLFIAKRANRLARGWLSLARKSGQQCASSRGAATQHRLLRHAVLVSALAAGLGGAAWAQTASTAATNVALSAAGPGFVGSRSCQECHSKFYQLWSTSFHGLAMQPYTPELAKTKLTPQATEIVAGKYRFLADIQKGLVIERDPKGEKRYPIVQVMGGKNVFYFLTPLERGWLQVLPVAYDVRR